MSESPLDKLLDWYRKHVKPYLVDNGLEKVEEYDSEILRLEKIRKALYEKIPVCFLGNAGIGKSTLINAIVFGKEIYIPSGGVGPLTAQALAVCYGEHASFEVLYHTGQRYNNVLKGLQWSYQAKLKREAGRASAAALETAPAGDPSDDGEEFEAISSQQSTEDTERRVDDLRKQALLMVAGRQDAQRELPYLIDALLAVNDKPPLYGNSPLEEDRPRISRLKTALTQGMSGRSQLHREGDTPEARAEFLKLLHDHATGFLAPLIKDLTVKWNQDLLRDGLTLVDLPGVGIAGDIKANITEEHIREQAKAVVLVVSSRGVQQTEAELLRNSGFLNRLLHASDDPSADPVSLMVVVTRIDDIAEEHFAQDRSRRKVEHFAEVCAQVKNMVKQQLRSELEKVWRSVTGLSEEKKGVIEEILNSLQIHPVSALQYRRFLSKNFDDDPWFIQNAEQSNMPQLIEALHNLSRQRSEKQRGHLEAEAERFFRRIRARLQVIRTQWENQLHAAEEADALRAKLESFVEEKKLRARFSTRQGAYREFLKSTLPVLISKNVTEASVKAREEIFAYMQDMQFYHWATLRAAVVRGGTYAGARHIDLPKDIALRFEEPIAESWGKTLLQEIRKRTKEYADDTVSLVEEILAWAKQEGAKVKTTLLEAEIELIREDAKQLKAVGKEAVDDLRQKVQAGLVKKIEPKIRRKCEEFVKEGEHIGPGVKDRILRLFRKLSNESVDSATEPAIDLLTDKFREVEAEILAVFKEHKEHTDPIESAVNAIVASHEQRTEREDRKKKQLVLDGLNKIVQECPISWEDKTEAQTMATV